MAALIIGFGASFFDLLYPGERAIIGVCAGACLFVGFWLGQLQLLSRDLRGSELGSAAWGSYRELTRVRREIAEAVSDIHERQGS